MASMARVDAALSVNFNRNMRDVHTAIRATITDVDYDAGSCTAQPMASTNFSDGTADTYPPIYDVPLQVYAANNGKARLTMPVKPGDIVGLTFSERNENDASDVTTHGLNAGWAITEVFPNGGAKIHPDNVELWNDQVHFSMTPDGSFTLETPTGKLLVDKSGQFSFTNGAATLQALPSGSINMNGAQVTPDGNIITKSGVNVDDFFAYFKRHVHHYAWTDGEGQSNTAQPN